MKLMNAQCNILKRALTYQKFIQIINKNEVSMGLNSQNFSTLSPKTMYTDFEKAPQFYSLPEIPMESVDSNQWLDSNIIPKLNNVCLESIFTGISRLIIDYQMILSNLNDELIKNEKQPSVLDEIEQASRSIDEKLSLGMCAALLNNDMMLTMIMGRLRLKHMKSKNEYLLANHNIFNNLLSNLYSSNTTAIEKEVIESILKCGWSMGAHFAYLLDDSKSKSIMSDDFSLKILKKQGISKLQFKQRELKELLKKNMNTEVDFQRQVLNSSFALNAEITTISNEDLLNDPVFDKQNKKIINESDLSSFYPGFLVNVLGGSRSGGFVTGMHLDISNDAACNLLLQYARSKKLRNDVWNGLNQRSTQAEFGGSGQQASNEENIESMRKTRQKIATVLDQPDYLSAIWYLTGNSARGPSSPQWLVDHILEPLREELFDVATKEWSVLTNWFKNQPESEGNFEPWDINYAIHQFNMTSLLKPGCTIMENDFTKLSHSPKSALTLALSHLSKLLTIDFEIKPLLESNNSVSINLIDGTLDCQSCSVINVLSKSGDVMGEILVDMMFRPMKTSIPGVAIPLVLKRRSANSYPVACLYGNIESTSDPLAFFESNSLMRMDVIQLCSVLAYCVQYICSISPEGILSGQSNSLNSNARTQLASIDCFESDMRFILSDLCTLFVRDHLNGSDTMDSGKKLNSQDKDSISHIAAIPLLRLMERARFDLAIWSSDYNRNSWKAIAQELHEEHMPYEPHPKALLWPCSAADIFGPNSRSGTSYVDVWRWVVACDTYAAIKEASSSSSHQEEAVMKKFKDSMISNPSTLSPNKMFKMFRGREPSPQYLLDNLSAHTIV